MSLLHLRSYFVLIVFPQPFVFILEELYALSYDINAVIVNFSHFSHIGLVF